jgi:hypothetical protein
MALAARAMALRGQLEEAERLAAWLATRFL